MSNILFQSAGIKDGYKNDNPKIPILVLIFFILIALLAVFISGCKKEKPQYTVTYTFESASPRYYVQIWDITEQNDFADSVSGTFTKTIIYDYAETWRCRMDNRNNIASFKKISITYNNGTVFTTDTLYPSLDFFRTP